MPLFAYFGWAGSFLFAALLAANWCLPAPLAPQSGVPLDQKISIRIHTDHKWPERVVLDTSGTMAAQEAGAETGIGESEPAVEAARLEHDGFKSNRRDAHLTSPRRGEVEAGAPRRLGVRGLSARSDSRKVPSPAAHLTMRVDLSPAGER
jgi:hypothetical protein